jgi:hypothetical protein
VPKNINVSSRADASADKAETSARQPLKLSFRKGPFGSLALPPPVYFSVLMNSCFCKIFRGAGGPDHTGLLSPPGKTVHSSAELSDNGSAFELWQVVALAAAIVPADGRAVNEGGWRVAPVAPVAGAI